VWEEGDKKAIREDMIKIHYMYVWKYHNETSRFVQLIFTNKIIFKDKKPKDYKKQKRFFGLTWESNHH
jgi:hypothetical protein